MQAGKYILDFKKPLIMGIVNVTPDSFYDGGKYNTTSKAIEHALKLAREGADIIDIGGESTRPGAEPIIEELELARVIPVIEKLSHMLNIPISIDTHKPNVAEAAIKAGASIINDITGLSNDSMAHIAKKYDLPIIIMHMKGTPKEMQKDPKYRNVIAEILEFFRERVKKAKYAGIKKIILDPGIGFGKTVQHNLAILKNLKTFKELGYPLLIGTSRKSFIGRVTNSDERLPGSLASAVICIVNGADIVRVHDVKETKQAIQIMEAIKNDAT